MKWGTHFDLANKRDRVEELDKTMEEPGFWDNPEHSTAVVQESKKLKSVIERYESLCTDREDMLTLIEIGEEENDVSLVLELEDSLKAFEGQFEELRIETLLSGEYDKDNAILTLHAGAGGQRAVTGRACCAVCMSAGQKKEVFRWRCLIFWTATRQAISQSRFRLMA